MLPFVTMLLFSVHFVHVSHCIASTLFKCDKILLQYVYLASLLSYTGFMLP